MLFAKITISGTQNRIKTLVANVLYQKMLSKTTRLP